MGHHRRAGRAAAVTSSRVVSLVSRCEKLGLVYRQKGVADKRIIEVHLTPAGEKAVGKLARMHRDELLNLQGIFQVPGSRELLDEEEKNDTPKKRTGAARN